MQVYFQDYGTGKEIVMYEWSVVPRIGDHVQLHANDEEKRRIGPQREADTEFHTVRFIQFEARPTSVHGDRDPHVTVYVTRGI